MAQVDLESRRGLVVDHLRNLRPAPRLDTFRHLERDRDRVVARKRGIEVDVHDVVAEIRRELDRAGTGYGMLAAKHNNIVDADGLVHCAVKDKDCSSVCDVNVRDKFADRHVSVHNADVISGRIERPAKQSLLLVHLKQWMTFRAERNDL